MRAGWKKAEKPDDMIEIAFRAYGREEREEIKAEIEESHVTEAKEIIIPKTIITVFKTGQIRIRHEE